MARQLIANAVLSAAAVLFMGAGLGGNTNSHYGAWAACTSPAVQGDALGNCICPSGVCVRE